MRLFEFIEKNYTCPLQDRRWDDGGDAERTIVNPLPRVVSSEDPIYNNFYDEYDEAEAIYKQYGIEPEIQEVPFNKIIGSELCLSPKGSKNPSNPIEVIHVGAWFFIVDGNHRAAAAYNAGKNTITAKVYSDEKAYNLEKGNTV